MQPVSELRRREVETYFGYVAEHGGDVAVDALAFHNLGVYDDADFARLADVLAAEDAAASFAFLGRDADAQGDIVRDFDEARNEVVLHGFRHVACGDLTEELARANVERGVDAIEAASGVRPRAFFAPLLSTNDAVATALAEAGIEWTLGRATGAVPDGLAVVEPEPLIDLELLVAGHSPEETFARLGDRAEEGGVFIVHPNVLEYFDATDALIDWIASYEPTTVREWLETGGVGLVVDAVRPLRIE